MRTVNIPWGGQGRERHGILVHYHISKTSLLKLQGEVSGPLGLSAHSKTQTQEIAGAEQGMSAPRGLWGGPAREEWRCGITKVQIHWEGLTPHWAQETTQDRKAINHLEHALGLQPTPHSPSP